MNDTEALEERVVVLEAEMDIVQSTLVILQDEVNEVQDDVDLLETEDSLFDQRLILVEAEIANNENAIDGDILSFKGFDAIGQRFSKEKDLFWDPLFSYHMVRRVTTISDDLPWYSFFSVTDFRSGYEAERTWFDGYESFIGHFESRAKVERTRNR